MSLKYLSGCKPKPAPVRFAASYLVQEDGCWIWQGSDKRSDGYGSIKVNGRVIGAHRYSWMLHRGDIPRGLLVCHRCDVPLCVNPEHLFLGTHQDNNGDCAAKGRAKGGTKTPLPGVTNSSSKLTEADVHAIRASTETFTALGARFGVSRTQISNIKRGLQWTHLPSRITTGGPTC